MNQDPIVTQKKTESPGDRTSSGKFAPGNQLGSNPQPYSKFAKAVMVLLRQATSQEQILKIWGVILIKAEEGDMRAITLFFERLLGPAANMEMQEKLDALEERVVELMKERNATQPEIAGKIA